MSSVYRQLDPARPEIRLLKLHPADDLDAEICCSLIQTPVDDAVPYEALSYTWGGAEFDHRIKLDGHPFSITANLDSALRYLRQPAGDRVLWVDAICINQADVPERNHQVTLMKSIYQRCRADLAWLGPNPSELQVAPPPPPQQQQQHGDGQSDLGERVRVAQERQAKQVLQMQEGMALMKKMCARDVTTLDIMAEMWRDSGTEEMGPDGKPQDGKDRWMLSYAEEAALAAVFRRASLWKRIWVMQELSCAPKVVLLAGREALDWDLVASFLGDTPYADAFHISWSHGWATPMARHVFGHAQTIQHQRGIVQAMAEGYRSTLMDVLARFKHAASTDQRDKIYGLLGLVSEDHGIRVNYGKSVGAVFAELTEHFINSSGTLDVLCQNPWQIDDWGEKTEGLPSWVADFAHGSFTKPSPNAFSTLLFAQRGIFSAGSPSLATPCHILDGSILRVEGTIIGKVGPILQEEHHYAQEEARKHTQTPTYLLPKECMSLYFGTGLLDDPSISYAATGESALQAFWRTLVADCKAYPIARLSGDDLGPGGAVFSEVLRTVPEADEKETDRKLRELFGRLASERMLQRTRSRWTFAVSDNGLFLLLRRGTREGDILAVVDGGKVPVVLRPTEGPDGVRYAFVNVAYVHGYMDGRAGEEVVKGKLQRQEFLLV